MKNLPSPIAEASRQGSDHRATAQPAEGDLQTGTWHGTLRSSGPGGAMAMDPGGNEWECIPTREIT